MNNVIENLRQAARKLVRELGVLQLNMSRTNRTPQHWHALIEIKNEPNITIANLGHLLLLTPSNMSRIVSALVKEGLVDVGSGVDKREKYLQITAKGNQELHHIDEFSVTKVKEALEYLTVEDQQQIIAAMQKYADALYRSRSMRDKVKIHTLSTSRVLRKQIISMIESIQKQEFSIPVTEEINIGILKAENEYYFNHSCNFWYAVDDEGKIIGSIGLKKINKHDGEIKKFFVAKSYRGKGVARRLLSTLLTAAVKHRFSHLYLGTVDVLHAAKRFYEKSGFVRIPAAKLPAEFIKCELDTLFFKSNTGELQAKLSKSIQ